MGNKQQTPANTFFVPFLRWILQMHHISSKSLIFSSSSSQAQAACQRVLLLLHTSSSLPYLHTSPNEQRLSSHHSESVSYVHGRRKRISKVSLKLKDTLALACIVLVGLPQALQYH